MPEANLIVISFLETPWEPKYLNNIKSATKAFNGRFYLWDDVKEMPEHFWSELAIDIIRLRDFGKDWKSIFMNLIQIFGWVLWFIWFGFGKTGNVKKQFI